MYIRRAVVGLYPGCSNSICGAQQSARFLLLGVGISSLEMPNEVGVQS